MTVNVMTARHVVGQARSQPTQHGGQPHFREGRLGRHNHRVLRRRGPVERLQRGDRVYGVHYTSCNYDVRKYLFYIRVVNVWNSLPNEVQLHL